ncbi:MAG: TldD/PmbA family protein [Clostridiales bacterium]|nr:TldD/PmbA family protein [Clostridiales bacterium]
MQFSEFLSSRKALMKALCAALQEHYEYVSVLGVDVKAKSVRADRNSSSISAGRDTECGFVVKMSDGKAFFEYSLDDIQGDISALCAKMVAAFELNAELGCNTVGNVHLTDDPLTQEFSRECDLDAYTDDQLLSACKETCQMLLGKSEHLLNAIVSVGSLEVSKLFITRNRDLSQHYAWVNGMMAAVYRDHGKVVQSREGAYDHTMKKVLADLPTLCDKLLKKADALTRAKAITPGVYDVITDSSITGLIAHEAFGHGVEMDQFVKDRALAKEYVGKYVASPICNMRDGAAGVLSAASYFFDDDGVLAHDTQIIKDGILVTGISDLASATQLGLPPTGNGRRESSRRKAYARMTNTYFEKGNDKLEDMIASIKHGYMLFETNNGMEDPKNWAIQCVAEYGIEIVDGKLTDNYVSPVVMSGYVPDLLKSISMVSDDFKVIGSGSCGKGYKEWVRVSDGGPALKVKVKLG